MAHLLLAVDETDASARASAFVERFFSGSDARITAVNVARTPIDVIPPVPYGGVYGWPWPGPVGGDQAIVDQAVGRAATEAETVATRQAPPGSQVTVVYGDPADAILRAAEDEGVDLIVVGSHHRGFLDRLVAGSVSEELVRKAPRPVLVVP